ncbi:MAG: hypothetical protein LBK70_02610 [Clostridiales bacterium]|jgi:hypothetical protein|nr:hypothetical protein [Clostridiales bacterium]
MLYGIGGDNALSKLNYGLVSSILYIRALECLYDLLKRHFAKGASYVKIVSSVYNMHDRKLINIYSVKMSELKQGNKYQSLYANCIQKATQSKLLHPEHTGLQVFVITND